MDIALTSLLCILALLLYFSDRSNKANKWCALAGFIFCLGVFKEAFFYSFVPWFHSIAPGLVSQQCFMDIYSTMTWVLYSFAMPAAVVFAMYSCNIPLRRPRFFRWLSIFMLLPVLVFTFMFPPLVFRDYQLVSVVFWRCFSSFNLLLGCVFAFFLLRGVRKERDNQAKKQKKMVAMVFMPPIIYWLITIFIIHPLNLSRYFKLWRGNTIIVLFCIVLYIWIAFRDGMMGLRLRGETYHWNSDMAIIHKGAEFTGHMMKNQAAKMEWCIENLQAQYRGTQGEPPEELAILERSILSIKSYVEREKKYSDRVVLLEESCTIAGLMPRALSTDTRVALEVTGGLLCDRTHISEVFQNLVNNGLESMEKEGTVTVTEGYEQEYYLLKFTDNGCGMEEETVKRIFTPYFTTKNTEKNFGLGLVYCQNVMEKHGGLIRVHSTPGEGSCITLCFPKSRRIEVGE